jgi:glucose-6-phosphate dehydrogenase assembly protein OpcA
MAGTIERIALGEPRPADVAAIERDLAALWRSMADADPRERGVTRACALTLLVYVESEEAEQEVTNLIGGIIAQDPCRVVVMVVQPDAPSSGLTAWISAHCHLPKAGERQVCCEQIGLRARGTSVRDLDNVVVPLTVPGLPVILWWRAGRFAPPDYFRNILRVTDHLLVDSARFADPAKDLGKLAAELRHLSAVVPVSDLNWTRVTPWRGLVAQCFDPAETSGYLEQLADVQVEYEQESPRCSAQRAQALLLIGWLASRLGWEIDSPVGTAAGEGSSISFRSRRGKVEVRRVPKKFEGGGAGVCFAITMTAGGPSSAVFTLRRGPDGKYAVVRRELPGRPAVEGTACLELYDEVELVNEGIKSAGRDAIFEEALEMVARITTG